MAVQGRRWRLPYVRRTEPKVQKCRYRYDLDKNQLKLQREEGPSDSTSSVEDTVVNGGDREGVEPSAEPKQSLDRHVGSLSGHHSTFLDLQSAAEAWCQFCRLLWDSLSDTERHVAAQEEHSQGDTASPVTEVRIQDVNEQYLIHIQFTGRESALANKISTCFMLHPVRGVSFPDVADSSITAQSI